MTDGGGFTSYSVDNDRIFRETLARCRAQVGDLRIPLTLISKDFYRSQKAIWALGGPGQYPDLAESTKASKKRRGRPIYPMLRETGKLEESAANPSGPGSINEIINQDTLVMGVKGSALPYAIFLQEGTKKMPMRKFIFIGPEAPRFANSDQAGRLERWKGMLEGYVLEKVRSLGEVSNA